jgi:hypothetical protein
MEQERDKWLWKSEIRSLRGIEMPGLENEGRPSELGWAVAQTSKSAVSRVSKPANAPRCVTSADLEVGDTAGLETCATNLSVGKNIVLLL